MRHFLFLFIILTGIRLEAQTNWLLGTGGNSQDEAIRNTTDSAGNIYTTGYFGSLAKFGTILLTSEGSRDIFITKQDINGNLQWAKRAGGALSDKPYNIATDRNGHVFITGYFTGQARFGTIVLNATNNSQDIFVACLDASGNFLWAKKFGSIHSDIASGLTCDRSGNVIVTGQFKGSIQFGAYSFTSLTNPTNGQLSYDAFILKLNPGGNVTWAKQGKGIYDDRGIAVTSDNNSSLYITGQFSGNLTFSQQYQNNGFNVSFLMKIDSLGNEKWFKRIFATQVLVYDLKIKGNKLFVAGDFQGQLYISGNPPTYASSAYTYKIFLVKMDTTGNVTWVRTDGSDNPLTLQALAVDNNENSYLTGVFKCVFDEYASTLGPGLFNSVGYNDVFLTRYNTNGERVWARQFGGPSEDFCSAVAVTFTDHPIIAGSFEKYFNVPSNSSFTVNTTNHDSSAAGPLHGLSCGDPNFGSFISLSSKGNKDIFFSAPYNAARSTYDYYERTTSCIKNIIPPVIHGNGAIATCDTVQLRVDLYTGRNGIIGPEYNFLWNTGETGQEIQVQSTGTYSVTISTADGCRTNSDAIPVQIYGAPAIPTISYDAGTFYQAIPGCLNKLSVHLPTLVTLTGGNITPGYQFHWQTPTGNLTDTSIIATSPGSYSFIVEAPGGACGSFECIEVVYFQNPSGDCNVVDPEVFLVDSIFEATDTVTVCYGDYFGMNIRDSISQLDSSLFIPAYGQWQITGGFNFYPYISYPTTFGEHLQQFKADTSGPCTVKVVLLHPFTLAPIDTLTKNFYLIVNPLPQAVVEIHGNSHMCPGDTVTLHITGGSDYTNVGPGIIYESANRDILKVTRPGVYSTSCFFVDSLTGCSNVSSATFTVNGPEEPGFTMLPANGIVCPGDSVLLTAETGSNYHWYGPSGITIGNNQSIYVSIPGDYHYDMIDSMGCFMISSSKEVKEYTTPFVSASPAAVICSGQSLTLTVMSNDTSAINWIYPITGNSTTITVSDTGKYICSVSSCGIISTDTVEIKLSQVNASILQGDSITICPGSSFPLQAVTGSSSYSWNDGHGSDFSFPVDSAGIYTLMVTDEGGCIDIDTIHVYTYPEVPAPLVRDTTICFMSTITLSVSSSYNISWYNSIMDIIDSGFVHTLLVQNDTILYVTAKDSLCESEKVPLHISMSQVSTLPYIVGHSVYCAGEPISLTVDSLHSGLSYSWLHDSQAISSDNFLQIANADTTHNGYYKILVMDNNCSTESHPFLIDVIQPSSFTLTGITTLCEGDSIHLEATNISGANYEWTLPDNSSYQGPQLTIASATSTHSGVFTIQVTQHDCASQPDSISVTVNASPQVSISGDSIYCKGEMLDLYAAGNADNYTWSMTNGFNQSGSQLVANSDTLLNGVIYLVSTTQGCLSTDSIQIIISEATGAVISGHSSACEKETVTLSSGTIATSYLWTGPAGFDSQSSQIQFTAEEHTEGWYVLNTTDSLGCSASPDSMEVIVHIKPFINLDENYELCSDSSLTLNLQPEMYAYEWNSIPGDSSYVCSGAMTLNVTVYSAPGCYRNATVTITEINCQLQIPNVFSPNGDGINDTYRIVNSNGRLISFDIYNRWGKVIAEFDADFEWDGNTLSGVPADEGVYYYQAVILNEKGENEVRKGFIELMR